ncbi:MAG: hypothetical protein Q8L85_09480 [Alphaproteobacteria bacterium]|nr:hypothetical protein [Alphaproteobacteria bacterium]
MSIYKKSNLLSFHTLILFIIIMIISDSAHARVAIFTAPIPFENSTKGAQIYLDLDQLEKKFKKEIKKAGENKELLTKKIIKDLFIDSVNKKAIKIKIVDLHQEIFIEEEKPIIEEHENRIDPIVEQTIKNRILYLTPEKLKAQHKKLKKMEPSQEKLILDPRNVNANLLQSKELRHVTPDPRPKPAHNVWPQLIEDTIQNFKKAPQIIKPDYEQFPDESEIGLNYFGIAPLSLKEVDAEDHKEQIEDEHNNEGLTEDENPFALYPEQDLLDQEDEESKSEQPIMLAESLIKDDKQPIEIAPSLKPVQNNNWINGIRPSARSRLFIKRKDTPKPSMNELNQQELHTIQIPQEPSSAALLSPLTQTPALLPDIHESGNKIINNSKSLHSPSINTPKETSTPPFIPKKSKKKIKPIVSDQASPSILQSNTDIKRTLENDTPKPVHGNQHIENPNEASTPPFIPKKSKKKISRIIPDQASPSILQSNSDIIRILENDTPKPVHGNQHIENTKETSTPPFIPKKAKKKISRIIPDQTPPSTPQSNRDIKRILESDTPKPVPGNQNIENIPIDFNIPFVTSPKKGTPLKPSTPYDDLLSPIYNEQAQFTPQPQSVQVFHVRPLESQKDQLDRVLKERDNNSLARVKKTKAQKERRKALPYDQPSPFFADPIDENSINPITQHNQKEDHITLPNDLAMPKPQETDDTVADNNERRHLPIIKPLNITQEPITPPFNSKKPKSRIKPIVLDQISPITTNKIIQPESDPILPTISELVLNPVVDETPPIFDVVLPTDNQVLPTISEPVLPVSEPVLPTTHYPTLPPEINPTLPADNPIFPTISDPVLPTIPNPVLPPVLPTINVISPVPSDAASYLPPHNEDEKEIVTIVPPTQEQPKNKNKPIVIDQISPITITPSPRVIYYPSWSKKLFQDLEEELNEKDDLEEEDDLDDADPIDNNSESYKKINILGNDVPKPTPSFIPPPPPAPSLQDLTKPRLMPQKDSEIQQDRTIKKQVAKPTPNAFDNHLHSSLALRRAQVVDSPESSPETKAPKFKKPIGKEIKPIEFKPEPKKSAALQKISKDLNDTSLKIVAICDKFRARIKSTEQIEESLIAQVIIFKNQSVSGFSQKTSTVGEVRRLYKDYEALKNKHVELKGNEQKQIQKEAAEAEKRVAIEAEKAAARAEKEAKKRRKAAQPDVLDRAKIAAVKFTDLIKGFVFKKKDEIVREDIEMDDFKPSQSIPNIPIAKDPNPPAGGSSETIMDSLAQKINMFKIAPRNVENSGSESDNASDSDDDWDD